MSCKLQVESCRLNDVDLSSLRSQLSTFAYQDRKELEARLRLYAKGFKNCYGLKQNGTIIHLQWIIFPSENELLSQHCKHRYTLLKAKQVMLENAFTFPGHQNRGFHLAVTAELLRLARAQGYTNAVSYIHKDNLEALNDFLQLGFQMVKIIPEYTIFGAVRRSL